MEASLQIPTATSVRTLPVRTLEENRRLLNKHREGAGKSKVSFTHVVAWAILRALDTFPRLNDAYAEVDQTPHRIQRDEVRLGIAVDVQKKDGSRTLLVPNIKGAQKLGFAEFLAAFDELVARSRKGQISPDDFMGTSVSLTNPGTVGTTSSAPRLMPGQGVIIATGALDYPAEYKSMAPRTLGMLGISKVMTVTSTYDHRIIQGAESGLFLSRIEELLKGEDGFYERIFGDLGMPHRPVRWEMDATPGLFGPPGGREEVEKQTKVLQLIHNYRVRGHLVADLDPLDRHRAPHRDLDPATYGLTLWDLDREFMTGGLSGEDRATLREILDMLRETYCGTIGVEYMYIADPERKEWLQHRMESTRNYPALDAASKKRVLEKVIEAESFERFLHTKYVGHKRFSLEGGETLIPLLDRILNDAALVGVREVVIGMSHRGRLNVLANTVGKPISQIFAEFEGNDPSSYQGSGDVKYHLGATGTHLADTGEKIAVTVAPNPSHLEFVNPGGRGHGAREAGARPRSRARARAPAPAPRRRRLRRPGDRGGDAEPLGAARLPDRRHDPRRRQQPDRLHHAARGRAQLHLRDRRRQDGARAGAARERRRPRGGRLRREPRARVPPEVQEGRGDRHRLLPALGPQRDRRAELHAAADVRADQEPPLGGEPLRREARARGHRHQGGARRALGREEGRDAVRGRRGEDPLRRHRAARAAGARAGGRFGDVGQAQDDAQGARHDPGRARDPSEARALREEAAGAARGQGRRRLVDRPSRSRSARCCSRACRCGCRARTRAAAPSRSGTRSSTTFGRRRSTCRSAPWRLRACASRSTTRCSPRTP